MFRVVLTGSYKRPRRLIGVGVVFSPDALLSFTGYLLPDDQLDSGRSLSDRTWRERSMLGHEGPFGPLLGMTAYNDVRFDPGGSIGDSNALLRSYIWHCIGIPLVASIFMAVHWRIRKDGGDRPAAVMLESEIKAIKRSEVTGAGPTVKRASR